MKGKAREIECEEEHRNEQLFESINQKSIDKLYARYELERLPPRQP